MKSLFRRKKIYKFVFTDSGYKYADNRTTLIAAVDPVDAVEKFNKLCGNKLANIIEFVVVTPKGIESEGNKT